MDRYCVIMDRLAGWARRVAGQVEAAIEASDLSKTAVAEITGIPKTTFLRRLRGQDPFDLTQLELVADALDMHLLEFFATDEQRRAS